MPSRGKKTTMAKLSREARLRERRVEKKAKKDARKRQAADGPPQTDDAVAGRGAASPEQPGSVDQELAPDAGGSDAVMPDAP
jgi:hypothetical protein